MTRTKVESVQTVAGTGAIHLAALLVADIEQTPYLNDGVPTWGNTILIMKNAGLKTIIYPHLNAKNSSVDFDTCIDNIRCVIQRPFLLPSLLPQPYRHRHK